MIAVATIATAAVSMTLAQAPDQEAAQDIGAPLPPRVDFAAAPASRLRLGMTALEVTRIMGEPAKVTHYAIGETEMTRLDFPAGQRSHNSVFSAVVNPRRNSRSIATLLLFPLR